jgi:oxysterol-binding protein-related protein 9/10/11
VICAADSLPAAPLQIPDLDAQDPWESRNAWKDVPAALVKGDIPNIVKEKTKLEEAQRAMRKKEAAGSFSLRRKMTLCSANLPPL